MAIRSFANRATEDINYARRTKAAMRLHAADVLMDLSSLPGNRFEKLKGDRAVQYSIRLNDQYRICFDWTNASAENVEIVDYH